MFKNLHILSGRNASNKLNIPKYAFLVEGTLQCDQMLVENCDFMYCSTIIKSTNENAVNWFFNHISATSNIENNVHQTFALGTLWKLAQVLEIDMYKLCIEEDTK